MVRHISVPIEDDFEYSCDEAEENAAALLRDPPHKVFRSIWWH